MSNKYTADDVKYLTDIEHIRLRSGMYIGELDNPKHLLVEIIDNSCDEVQNGNCDNITVICDYNRNEYEVYDNGRGIPTGYKTDPTDSTKELTVLEFLTRFSKSGGKFDDNSYKIRSGLHGLGTSVVTALSEYSDYSTARSEGSLTDQQRVIYCNKSSDYLNRIDTKLIDISKGHIRTVSNELISVTLEYTDKDNNQLSEDIPITCHGTRVLFKPDESLFDSPIIPLDFVIEKCKICNAHYKGTITLYIREEDDRLTEVNVSANLESLIYRPNYDTNKYYDKEFNIHNEDTGESLNVYLEYNSDTKYIVDSYCNLLRTRDGGTHYKSLVNSIESVWSKYIVEYSESYQGTLKFRSDDCRTGMYGALSIQIIDPSFTSQTKDKLSTNSDKFSVLFSKFEEEFDKWLRSDDTMRLSLLEKFKEYRVNKDHVSNRKDISKLIKLNTVSSDGKVKRKSVVSKLTECTSSDRSGTELYIVEGDSAGGIVVIARDYRTQAVLPLRGKIKNISGLTIKQALENSEVRDIINSIGIGVGEGLEVSNSRYEKIFINVDSDSDGCVSGDTRIKSLDGKSYTFKELVDNKVESLWVYSKDKEGNMVPGYAHNPHITKYISEVTEVVFPNGHVTRCTPDHRFLLTTGEYVQAQYLTTKDDLSYLKFRDNLDITLDYKILKVRSITLEEPIPVYDLTVDNYHNFLIETSDDHMEGVIIHNSHIANLVVTVFMRLLPDMVKSGMVYVVEPPLYKYVSKGKPVYTNDFNEIPKGSNFTRYKGLGEMNREDYKETCIGPNRKYYRVDYPEDVNKFYEIMSTSEGKRNVLKDLGLLVDLSNEY